MGLKLCGNCSSHYCPVHALRAKPFVHAAAFLHLLRSTDSLAVQVTTGPADEDLDVPYKDLRLFIAVTSTCCSATSISAARRRAARSTWVQIVLDSTVNTDVRFVLAQPAPEARQASEAAPAFLFHVSWKVQKTHG